MSYELLDEYKYLIVMFVLVGAMVFLIKFAAKRDRKTGSRSLLSYLLIWPLLMDGDTKSSSPIVKWGVVIMILLIVGSFILHPATR